MNNAHSTLIDITKCRSNRRKRSHVSVQNQHIEEQSRSVISNQHLKISDIKAGMRFRKDLAKPNRRSAESIKNNGLIHAVTITKDRVLIAGIRRIEAFKSLRIEDIPVHVLDIPIKENGEIDETSLGKILLLRKKLLLKDIESQLSLSFQGQRSDLLELRGKFPQSDINQRRERIAKFTVPATKHYQNYRK